MCVLNLHLFKCVGIAMVLGLASTPAVECRSTKQRSPDAIGFPEVEENESLKNRNNRRPVFAPSVCMENELFYPGDQKDDWICDCMPAYIYHPKTDKCWPAYRKGPCEEGQYLILPKNSVLPICESNPCVNDTFVTFKGQCTKIGVIASCEQYHPVSVVGVNSTTLEVSCVLLNLDLRIGLFDDKPETSTSKTPRPGSKRFISSKTVLG